MRLVYWFTRRQFGAALTPLRVYNVRLPLAFGLFYGKVNSLDRRLKLPRETALLIRQQVARINACEFCVDMGQSIALQENRTAEKFAALPDYRHSRLFSEKERVALAYAEELTRLKQVARGTFERLQGHFSEREICEIVWLVASEHLYNISNLGLNIHSDNLCALAQDGRGAR